MKNLGPFIRPLCSAWAVLALPLMACGQAESNGYWAEGGDQWNQPRSAQSVRTLSTTTQAIGQSIEPGLLAGFVSSGDCTNAAHRQLINDAFVIARAQANVPNGALSACLKNSLTSYEIFRDVNNSPEEIMRRLGAMTDVTVRCKWGSSPTKHATSTLEAPVEDSSVTFYTQFLDANIGNPAAVAAVLLHEFSHTKGYKHPDMGDRAVAGVGIEYEHTVPEQVERCSLLISAGSAPGGNGTLRSSLPLETLLAPVGAPAGAATGLECIGKQLATGIVFRTGWYVDQLALTCRTPGVLDIRTSGAVGGSGGTPGARSCFAGELLVGLHGAASSLVDSVGPICADETSIRAGSTFAFMDPLAGGSGGIPYVRQCPAGMVVRGIRAKVGAVVDRFEIECQHIDARETPLRAWADKSAGPIDSGMYRDIDACPGRGALTGIMYAADSSRVKRLGGICNHIDSSNGWTDQPAGIESIFPSRGGIVNTWGDRRCNNGEVIVGFEYRFGSDLESLAPVCADAAGWSVASANTRVLPGIGKAYAPSSAFTTMCPLGMFAIGWDISYWSFVYGMRPICRSFLN
jgi:hypothetical protein